MTPRDVERFLSFVIVGESCWEWAAGKNTDGYGVFWLNRKTCRAHRVAYEFLIGPIQPTLTIDHLCRNRGCVNPAHMEPVSVRTNTLRGDTIPAMNARKTHCTHGHEFTADNTAVDLSGRRACRACSRRRTSIYRNKLKMKETTSA